MNSDTSDAQGPPYLPYATFISAVELLEQGLPPKLDRSVWPSQSGGVQSQLLKAFRFLRLTNDNDEVLPTLKRLVEERDRRKTILDDLLTRSYPKVIELAGVNASTQSLHDAFSAMGLTGDTRRKAETFFLQAADYAGIRLSSHWPTTKRRGANVSAARGRPKNGTRTGTRQSARGRRSATAQNANSRQSGMSVTGNVKAINLVSGGTVTLGVDVDWLTVSATDRKWLLALVDKLNEYDQSPEEPTAPCIE